MADDLRKHGPVDRKSINVDEPWEVAWWCRKLQCSEEGLRRAVKAVGISSTKVNEYLKDGK
jgi:hypothetical protein